MLPVERLPHFHKVLPGELFHEPQHFELEQRRDEFGRRRISNLFKQIVEVFAKDRPGLLYTVAATLHELRLSIALSKINTEGTRVADVFYVNELDGSKVGANGQRERFKEVRDALMRAIGEG